MITIAAQDGTPVEIYVEMTDGMVDAMIRATDLATFKAAALSQDLYYDDGDGNLVPSEGVNIDHIGPIMGVDSESGEPVVIDERYHLNLRIAEPALSKLNDAGYPKWKATAIAWTIYGSDDPEINSAERAKILNGVALIDPDTVASPSRVWFA